MVLRTPVEPFWKKELVGVREQFWLRGRLIGERPCPAPRYHNSWSDVRSLAFVDSKTGEVVAQLRLIGQRPYLYETELWDTTVVPGMQYPWQRASFFGWREWQSNQPLEGYACDHYYLAWNDVPAEVMAYEILNFLECYRDESSYFPDPTLACLFPDSGPEDSPDGGHGRGEDAQHSDAG